MKNLNKRVVQVLEENNFTVLSIEKQRGEHIAELETDSPAGEDFVMDVWFDGTNRGFVEAFYQWAMDFDPEEHVKMWIEAKENGVRGVPSIRDLVHDADAMDEILMKTAAELDTIEL